MPDGDATTELFEQHRPLLFAVAYRMLGSAVDAEDIVQEAYLRWRKEDTRAIASPKVFLTTVITRLCLDQLRAARTRRETYIGPWLPEPIATEEPGVSGDPAVLAESLSLAFLVLLETLTPVERAIFLLHDVFEYPFEEIAVIVGKTSANCRQIAQRARRRVHAARPRFAPDADMQERRTRQFVVTCERGDMAALLAMLTDDVTVWSDGGGKARAALRPITGGDNVARFLLGLVAKAPRETTNRVAMVNGQHAIIVEVNGQITLVVVPEFAGERISALRMVANPDKLRGVATTPPDPAWKPTQELDHGTDTVTRRA